MTKNQHLCPFSVTSILCFKSFSDVVNADLYAVLLSRTALLTKLSPDLQRSAVLAGLSRLTDAGSHSVPQVLCKVHLGLREHFVDDCFWDPALSKHQDRSKAIKKLKNQCEGEKMKHPPLDLC